MSRSQDHTVTTKFTGNKENTMNLALSNSVGMLLRDLRNQYFPNASEEVMNEQYEVCLEELRSNSEGDALRQASIENFIRRANEASGELDRVTFYLPQVK